MKTFEINIIKQVIANTINPDKYFKFTLKNKETGKPTKCKAKIETVFGTPWGMSIQFGNLYIKKKFFIKRMSFRYKNIRWTHENPFTKDFEDRCEDLQIKANTLKENSTPHGRGIY